MRLAYTRLAPRCVNPSLEAICWLVVVTMKILFSPLTRPFLPLLDVPREETSFKVMAEEQGDDWPGGVRPRITDSIRS
jgi:hypothetical protein